MVDEKILRLDCLREAVLLARYIGMHDDASVLALVRKFYAFVHGDIETTSDK